MGRESTYTEEVANEICEWLIQGKSLNSYCKQEGKVVISTVYKWLTDFPAFSEKYTRAKEDQADTLFDEIVDLSDESCDMIIEDENGKIIKRTDSAKVNHQRLRVDARKWAASKLKPKKYGERISVDSTNKNLNTEPTPEEREKIINEIINKAKE